MCAAARACETVRLRATTFASAWQRNWPAQADIAALQNAAKDMTALVRAAWPDVKTQPALVKEAHTALQQAMDAATQAGQGSRPRGSHEGRLTQGKAGRQSRSGSMGRCASY